MTGRDRQRASFLDHAGSTSGSSPATVVVNRVDVIGLRLAIRLLEAGYRVLGLQVASQCRQPFEEAGGKEIDRLQEPPNTVWIIASTATAELRPEQLAGLFAIAPARRSPRVQLLGGASGFEDLQRRTVSTMQIRPGSQSGNALTIHLAVGRHGTELGVSGDQDLFEQALPLLTALSDRVVFASGGTHSKN